MCAVHRVSSAIADHRLTTGRLLSSLRADDLASFVMCFTLARLDLINFAPSGETERRRSGGPAADRGRDMDGRPRQMNSQTSRHHDMPPLALFIICGIYLSRAQTACSVQNQQQKPNLRFTLTLSLPH